MAFDIQAIKNTFFDSEAVIAATDKATIRVLSKAGAFVRRKQKSLVRYRKKSSAPGQPPSAHRSDRFTKKRKKKDGTTSQQSASPLRELMFFGYDSRSKSVVEGPAKFFKKSAGFGQKTIPETLEHGGTVVKIVPVPVPKSGRKAGPNQSANFRRLIAEGRIQVPARQFAKRAVKIAPRPSAQPALESEAPKFAEAFKNAITR